MLLGIRKKATGPQDFLDESENLEQGLKNFLGATFKKFSIPEFFFLHLQQFKRMVPLVM
ncbi:hypothetical protein GGD38_002090 [Chitinophagaceae bacterium OAS944]|nr:hypothetical protein [Chitinophagaceae bacterium OAS944]